MCGRFVSASEKEELEKEFLIDFFQAPSILNYNVAPAQEVGIIINLKGYVYSHFMWGLVPPWSKDHTIGYKLINCRSETITEKPSFKNPFRRRRCLIPANGYYEWKQVKEDKGTQADLFGDIQSNRKTKIKKIPYYIHLKSSKLFSFAGIWDIWNSADGSQLNTFSIITTESIGVLRTIHHRCPVIITKENRKVWMETGEVEYKSLLPLLKPHNPDDIDFYEVSSIVNKPENNNVECIKPVN